MGRARLASAVSTTRRTIGVPATSHNSLLSAPMRVDRPAASTIAATAAVMGAPHHTSADGRGRRRCAISPPGSWPQVLRPERQHPFPGQFRGGAVIDVALLVYKGVGGLVAE